MQKSDKFGDAYLRLALETNRHVEGYVDAYYGPPELKAEVEAGVKRSPAELLEDLATLRDLLPGKDAKRQQYLAAMLRSMDCTLRTLNGEAFDYLDEVERVYDIRPQPLGQQVFEDTLNELDTLLPGKGAVPERMQVYMESFNIPPENLRPVIEMILLEIRQRTRALFSLGEESVDLALVADKPYGAACWYLGQGKSRIELNTELPISAISIMYLITHEVYPGHHTEFTIKDGSLFRGKGYAEQAVVLLNSPALVVSEGIADTALEIIFPDGNHHDWLEEVLLPAAGFSEEVGTYVRWSLASQRIVMAARSEAALLFHTGKLNAPQTQEFMQTYGLLPEPVAQRLVEGLSRPLYRLYAHTYTEGYRLIHNAAVGGDKLSVFTRVLTEQVLPSQLLAGN